jgi:hypothetical protein
MRRYFKSWAGYSFPRRPVGPIVYADTEALNSFYAAGYDENGHLTMFTKFLKRQGKQINSSQLLKASPGVTKYFKIVSGDDGQIKVGEELKYVDTEGVASYFQGRANENGYIQVLTTIMITVFFEDRYIYDSNHKLLSRELLKEDGSTSREIFEVK